MPLPLGLSENPLPPSDPCLTRSLRFHISVGESAARRSAHDSLQPTGWIWSWCSLSSPGKGKEHIGENG